MVIMWKGGMQVEKICDPGEPKVEALVCVSDEMRAIRAVDLIARGPARCHLNVKQFLDKLQQMTMEILDRKCPGTPVEKRYFSYQHIRQHIRNPISYSQDEVDAAKKDDGVLTRRTEAGTVRDFVIDLLAVDDDHIIYKLQSLSKHCSNYWLALGCCLLSQTADEVLLLTARWEDKTDKFFHVMETWIRKKWRTAKLDVFLTACDRVDTQIRQQIEEGLGIFKRQDPSTLHGIDVIAGTVLLCGLLSSPLTLLDACLSPCLPTIGRHVAKA